MKKTALLCIVSSALVATSAYADPKISGRVVGSIVPQSLTIDTTNLTQNTATTSKSDRTQFETDARLRFHGKEAMNDKTDFVYSLDFQLAIDAQPEKGNFTSRDTYIGVEHKDFGKVHVGRLYSRDYFARVIADNSIYFTGDTPWSSYGERTNNTISLHSPAFGPDKKTRAVVNYTMNEKAGDTEVVSGNINYDGDKLGLAAGFRTKKDFDTVTASATYKIADNTTVGATLNQAKFANIGTESSALVSVQHKFPENISFFAHAGMADKYGGYKDGKKTNLTLGAHKTFKTNGGTVEVFGAGNYANTTSFSVASEDKDATKKGDLIKQHEKGTKLEVGVAYFF